MKLILEIDLPSNYEQLLKDEIRDFCIETFGKTPTFPKAEVGSNSREVDPNFKKDVFEKKVQQHIEGGYSRETAEWKVLGDYNRLFFKFLGIKPNQRKTDANGYYI